MMRTLTSAAWLVALAGCATIVDPAVAATGAAVPVKAKASSAWTEAASKHNGSGVRLAYAVPAGLQPGQTGTVELRFSGVTDDDARVEWRAPAGGSAVSAQTGTATSMALPRGQVTTLALDVSVAADGMAYLDVFTTQAGRGSAQSVPIKVGSGAVLLKRDGAMQTGPAGEKVISLPSTPR
ncbi:MAG: hypothetical protein ABI281_00305 [Caldimonas sp.]